MLPGAKQNELSAAVAGESLLDTVVLREAIANFKRSWQGNAPLPLENVLSRVPEDLQPALFKRLLPIELASRRTRGESPSSAEYVQRFPRLTSIIEQLLEPDPESQDGTRTTTVSSPYQPDKEQNRPLNLPVRGSSHFQGVERYQLQGLLGKGGFGQVWRAHDALLDRTVAVKLLRSDRQLSQAACESLLREARRQAKLNINGIVPVHDVAESSGVFFIVTKLIEGTTLVERMKGPRIEPLEAARLIAQLARILHAAHVQNVVHRDIKPSNILIDAHGQLWVADFGIAATEEEQEHEAAEVVGTHAYMSPEQARGGSHLVDGRADIYSLGVILYEMLAGRRPFNSPSADRLLEEVVNRPPRPLRTIDPAIPASLEAICLRCLAKSAEQRYLTGLDLATALEAWTAEESKPNASSASRPTNRKDVRFLLTTISGLLLILVLPVVAVYFFRPA